MMKKSIIIVLLVIGLACNSENAELIGIWQDVPAMASGWSDNYQFFSDGTFKFNYSQMADIKPVIRISGEWEISKNGNLKLLVKEKLVLENDEEKTIKLDKPEEKELIMSAIETDSAHYGLRTIKISNIQYWQMTGDPNAY